VGGVEHYREHVTKVTPPAREAMLPVGRIEPLRQQRSTALARSEAVERARSISQPEHGITSRRPVTTIGLPDGVSGAPALRTSAGASSARIAKADAS